MKGGIDKGPCIIYWRLSYRRKFIRTIWFTPLIAVVTPLLFSFCDRVNSFGFRISDWINLWLLSVILLVLAAPTAVYTYVRWKVSEDEDDASGNSGLVKR